ncbi:MAG: hypothetical protein LUF92_16480 [Clostridiales bacterium]|nr:hypothetical protein [Clostridiales bacterium]
MPLKIISKERDILNVDADVKFVSNSGSKKNSLVKISKSYEFGKKYIIKANFYADNRYVTNDITQLRTCYQDVFLLVVDYDCSSVLLPVFDPGINEISREDALKIALETIRDFLAVYDIMVYLLIEDFPHRKNKNSNLDEYLQKNWIKVLADNREQELSLSREQIILMEFINSSLFKTASVVPPNENTSLDTQYRPLSDILRHLDESFSKRLLRFIDEKNYTDVEVYKRANVDRRLFSKIRKDNGYTPRKGTVLAFAIALRLNLAETQSLLMSAGYILSKSNRQDVILEYFIKQKRYDIFEINEVLFEYGEKTLGV